MVDLNKLIRDAGELAPLPASSVRLAELIIQVDCDLSDISEAVGFDQALTLRLLRVANSVASGPAEPIGDVRDAIARMGIVQVMALAVAAGARPAMQVRIPAYGLSEGALWRHSVASAVAVETMQRMAPFAPPPEAYTAALLHDIGKLVMGRYLDPEILGFIQKAQEVDHLDPLAAESLILQVNHGELGGLVAQNWKLTPRVILGITYHHNPGEGHDPVCDYTHVANEVAKRIEAGLDGRIYDPVILPDVAERLGITPELMGALCPLASSRFVQVSERYNAI